MRILKLRKGVNLITVSRPQTVYELLYKVWPYVEKVQAFEPGRGWITLSAEDLLYPGRGYWVRMSRGGEA